MDCEPMSCMRSPAGEMRTYFSGSRSAARAIATAASAPKCRFPAGQQPLRAGQLDFARRPGHRVAIRLAQQGVDESGGRGLVRPLHQFDAVVDGGVRRNALQVAKLVDAHAQRDAHFGIELARPARNGARSGNRAGRGSAARRRRSPPPARHRARRAPRSGSSAGRRHSLPIPLSSECRTPQAGRQRFSRCSWMASALELFGASSAG